MGLSDLQVLICAIDEATLSGISVILNCVVILIVIIGRKYRYHHYRLVAYLAMYTILADFGWISGLGFYYIRQNAFLCTVQGIWLQCFVLNQAIVPCTLATSLILSIIFPRAQIMLIVLEVVYNVAIPVLDIFLASVPFALLLYGPIDTPYCWIKNDEVGGWLRLAVFYLPAVIFLFYLSFASLFIIVILLHRRIKKYSKDERKIVKTLRYYPFVVLIGWAWPMLHRLLSVSEFYKVHVSVRALQGIGQAMVFLLFDPEARKTWLDIVRCRLGKNKARKVLTITPDFTEQGSFISEDRWDLEDLIDSPPINVQENLNNQSESNIERMELEQVSATEEDQIDEEVPPDGVSMDLLG